MYAEALVELIDMFRGERRYNKQLRHAALEAINEAVVATRAYEARVRQKESNIPNQENRDREEEVRIGGLWQRAAIKTADVSQDFAYVLYDKALYWFREFEWTAQEVLERKIDWGSIEDRIRELLGDDS